KSRDSVFRLTSAATTTTSASDGTKPSPPRLSRCPFSSHFSFFASALLKAALTSIRASALVLGVVNLSSSSYGPAAWRTEVREPPKKTARATTTANTERDMGHLGLRESGCTRSRARVARSQAPARRLRRLSVRRLWFLRHPNITSSGNNSAPAGRRRWPV